MTLPPLTDARAKRLHFRSLRRGFKEVDLVFGTFAQAGGIASLPPAELDVYEALLDAPDQDVWLWLQEKELPPAQLDTDVLAQLKALCRRAQPDWIR